MMDERKDARTDGQTDGRTWATLNALPHSTNSGGIKMAGEWRFNASVHRAKADRLVYAIVCFLSVTMLKSMNYNNTITSQCP